jgi:hypothetical protein
VPFKNEKVTHGHTIPSVHRRGARGSRANAFESERGFRRPGCGLSCQFQSDSSAASESESVDNDFKRECAFQDVTLESAEVARALLEELEIPYLRPRHCSRKGAHFHQNKQRKATPDRKHQKRAGTSLKPKRKKEMGIGKNRNKALFEACSTVFIVLVELLFVKLFLRTPSFDISRNRKNQTAIDKGQKRAFCDWIVPSPFLHWSCFTDLRPTAP